MIIYWRCCHRQVQSFSWLRFEQTRYLKSNEICTILLDYFLKTPILQERHVWHIPRLRRIWLSMWRVSAHSWSNPSRISSLRELRKVSSCMGSCSYGYRDLSTGLIERKKHKDTERRTLLEQRIWNALNAESPAFQIGGDFHNLVRTIRLNRMAAKRMCHPSLNCMQALSRHA